MRYVPPTAPNVCSYTTLAKTYCQISTCLKTSTGFISTELFVCSQAQFDIFAEIHQKKMLKNTRIAVLTHDEKLGLPDIWGRMPQATD